MTRVPWGGTRGQSAAMLVLAGGLALLAPACSRSSAPRPAVAIEPDSVAEAYARATAALMWPGAARAFEITPEGDLFNGAWRVRLDARGADSVAGPPRAIAYEQGWIPVAHWTRHAGGVRWDFEAVALPGGGAADSGLIVSLLARATNRGAGAREARLVATLLPYEASAPFVAWDADQGTPLRWSTGTPDLPSEGWSDGLSTATEVRLAASLAPGQSRAWRFVLPAYPLPGRVLRSWARTSHARRVEAARAYWATEIARGTHLELGDAEIEQAVNAARVVLLCCRERRGDRWMPIGGPFQYRDLWLRDGARAIAALAVTGYVREARDMAAALLEIQWQCGAFLTQRGQLDGTGQALWAFEQAVLRPAPADSVAKFANAAFAAWKWCEDQRRQAVPGAVRHPGLMPPADPRDNELVRDQLSGNDAWTLRGYAAAARLLRAAGRRDEADSVISARARYLETFLGALAHAPGTDVPPAWSGGGRDWGNLSACYPCAVLAAGDPRCARMAHRVWDAAGATGLVCYGTPDSLHYYAGADLGTWAMLAGDLAAAHRVLDAMLRWRTASGGGPELFSASAREFGGNLPPHATSAAALVTLVRNALVFDDNDTLQLTLAARERWWRGSRVLRSPTRWGDLDLSFRVQGTSARWQWTPVPVWTSLTLPPRTRLGAPPPPLVPAADGRGVLAPPGTREARVEIARDGRDAP